MNSLKNIIILQGTLLSCLLVTACSSADFIPVDTVTPPAQFVPTLASLLSIESNLPALTVPPPVNTTPAAEQTATLFLLNIADTPMPSPTAIIALASEPIATVALATNTPAPPLPAATLPAPTVGISASLTPLPDGNITVALQEAQTFMQSGQWEPAAARYEQVLSQPDASAVAKAQADWGFIQISLARRDDATAQAQLIAFLANYPDSLWKGAASFVLADMYQVQQNYAAALPLYQQYLALQPGAADSFVQEEIGFALVKLGRPAEALPAYQAAVEFGRAGSQVDVRLEYANLLLEQGNKQAALQQYQALAGLAQTDLQIAQSLFLQAKLHNLLGEKQKAIDLYTQLVNTYPKTYDSFSALKALQTAGITISPLQQGIIYYHAQETDRALQAFDEYLTAHPDDHNATAHYYAIQIYHQRQDPLYGEKLLILRNEHPNDLLTANAWFEYADALWDGGDLAGAQQTYQDFASAAPQNPRTGEALYYAGRLAERQEQLPLAISLWQQSADQYPAGDLAFRSAFMAAIGHIRQQDLNAARQRLEQASSLSSAGSEERGAALLWLGKTSQALGDSAAATSYWQAAQTNLTSNYYSLRAAELLRGQQPFASQPLNFAFNEGSEQAIAEAWLAEKLAIPNNGLSDWQSTIGQDRRWVQASNLLKLNRQNQAYRELNALRTQLANDALASYRLALACRTIQAYYCSIWAARNLVDALHLSNSFAAPRFITYLRYGSYFGDLVLPAAQKYQLNPAMLYALIRQESFFQTDVKSKAAAQGLMQIIPSTGEYIARKLAWPNYQDSDLYRPFLNVEFGAYYLHEQQRTFNGNLYAALAAYNAGPGNAQKWLKIAGNDWDLFLEVIRLQEPQRYVRRIFEFYQTYNWFFQE
jgi:soluble lytic murein transglycosylase